MTSPLTPPPTSPQLLVKKIPASMENVWRPSTATGVTASKASTETSANTVRKARRCCIAACCVDGWVGERMRSPPPTAVRCSGEEVTVPPQAGVDCTHTYGEFSYDSRCRYSCDEGYQLSSPSPLTCTASGEWSERPPTCDCERGDAYFQH